MSSIYRNVAVYLVGQQKCKRKQGWKKGGMAPLPQKLNKEPKNGKKMKFFKNLPHNP